MKRLGGLGFFYLLFLFGCGDRVSISGDQCRTHLPLDMSAQEYARCIQTEGILKELPKTEEDKALQEILRVGGRSLQWVKILKEPIGKEGAEKKSNTRDMATPAKYNAKTVIQKFVQIMQESPEFIRNVLFSTGELPTHVPLDEDTFYYHINLIKKNYSYAARWLLLKPYISTYKKLRMNDIRGYYFLSEIKDLKKILKSYSNLAQTERQQYKEWLLQMCFVEEGSDTLCQSLWERYEQEKQDLYDFYLSFKDKNKQTYDQYFQIETKRDDVRSAYWGGKQTFKVPFSQLANQDVTHFVKSSIETNWKGSEWSLQLSFVPQNDHSPRIEFKTGVLPHVDSLAGNVITMDDNLSFDDPENQTTMAHEFGHVLGFPDCYVEFYDSREELMVNYYIDTDNLMCALSGQVLPVHYEQLKSTYQRLKIRKFFDFLRP